MLHQKPTIEELEANRLQALKDLEELDKNPEKKEDVTPDPEKKEDEIIDDKKEEKQEDEDELDLDDEIVDDKKVEKKEEDNKDDKKVEKKEEVDWKKRYADSTRQEQVSRLKEQKLSDAYEQANTLPEPTVEEMKLEYPDWDELPESTKKLAIKTTLNDRRFAHIEKIRGEVKQVEDWIKKVNEFTGDPKTLVDNPDLEGKLDAFKNYATKEKRIGQDLGETVNSFLFLAGKARVQHKGAMFESGTGGSNEKRQTKSDKLTIEQGKTLRETNYKQWLAYVKQDKIATE